MKDFLFLPEDSLPVVHLLPLVEYPPGLVLGPRVADSLVEVQVLLLTHGGAVLDRATGRAPVGGQARLQTEVAVPALNEEEVEFFQILTPFSLI